VDQWFAPLAAFSSRVGIFDGEAARTLRRRELIEGRQELATPVWAAKMI
jgi:hypothetical protein